MVFIMFFGTEMPFLFLLTAGVSLGCLGGAVYYFMAVEFYMKNNAGLVMALAASVPYILQQLLTPLMGNKLINFAILVVLFCTITFFAIAHPNDFILDDSLPFAEETSEYRRSLVSDKLRVLIMFPAALIIAIYMEYTWGEALRVEAVNMYGWQRFAAILGCFYIGCLADYKKHRYMDVALVAAFLLYTFGTYMSGEAGMRLAFSYFLAGVYTGYLNIAFWFLAPKTRHPELWACLGRVLSLFEGFAAMVIGIVVGGSIAVRIITNISLLTMVMCLYALKGRGVTGKITTSSDKTNGSGWVEGTLDVSKFSFDTSTGTFSMGADVGAVTFNGTKLVVIGERTAGSSKNNGEPSIKFNGSGSATIIMSSEAKLTLVGTIRINGNDYASFSDAEKAGMLTVTGGTINTDGSITSTSTPIEVGSVAYEQNKTPSTSASYKVTSTDEGNRTVTYDKPAEGAEGTEQVKATVTLTDGNTYTVTAISENAFNNFENKNKIKKIEIADTVKEIGNNACKDMAELTDVTGGKGVTSIGKGAFSNCSKLKNFSGFDNLEIINEEAFNKCKKLTKVTIGVKVKKIGKKAYYKCSSLKNITVKSTKLTKKSKVGAKAFGKIHKKAKFKMKMSKKDAKKYKTKTIKVFKNKSIGYVNTWKVS
ncbi:leucine-rich repeat protein [Butyrivibrio sp. NC2002]|uniref:leucine-rich repeat protein n=1 Tax=Butyrivibrio sp. NC2002 TaxID=1410610 RepID=UPI0005683CB7|nr:leucine-rich repeat protein [Butyrivibrio sp. NC2002]